MVSLNEYLIHSAVTQAKSSNFPQPATHQRVVNFLHHAKTYDAMEEYLKANVATFEDLNRPLD